MENSIKDKLERLVKESVERTVGSLKRPFGLFLSGGVDSGLLAALSKPDVVFTCRFPYGPQFDEFDSAKATAEHLGLEMVVVEPTREDFFKYLPDALKMFEKTTHFSLVPLYMLFKAAKEEGITTILSGEGTDEYLGGYSSYSIILKEEELIKRLLSQPELQNYRPMIERYFGPLISRYARILGKDEMTIQPFWDKYENKVSKFGFTDLAVRKIEEMELALAKGWGVELIYPYMTEEIAEFCFKEIPDDMKVDDYTTKILWKKIAEHYLPRDVVWRTNKMGGPVAPVNIWLEQKDMFSKEAYLAKQDVILKG